ncbi:hypothetical protein EPA93_39350 [Ktedonosporobacter rubrisoli]|uniref:WD40 repeat domain-containing protein n=1 Tax=Ktedonosporobacter rubrisoli TaxID=2509675 RepID=A0A4P6K2J9_KTERU|nr:hypothetical protein [Ktedonosporobacter rubrisoli]QBD81706.1 hypothetical protein EPA93_39350 [Ktedonosporobacter rubrisoli]
MQGILYKYRLFPFIIMTLGLAILATGGIYLINSFSTQKEVMASSSHEAMATRATSVVNPQVCPPANLVRPATALSTHTGNQLGTTKQPALHQNLVYAYNTDRAGMLIRYDTATGTSTMVANLAHTHIQEAQLSTDGKTILFLSQLANHPAIQMIRIDGKNLQTLYCAYNNATFTNLLWSPDQQLAVFAAKSATDSKIAPTIQLLNLHKGTIKTLVKADSHIAYRLRAWNGNALVYMSGYDATGATPPHDVFMLDVLHDNIMRAATISGSAWSMNLTPDGKTLILSQCAGDLSTDTYQAPAIISTQPASGGKLTLIYASHVYAVTQVRAISNKSLLFIISDPTGNNKQIGLWRINVDGTGLKHLTNQAKRLNGQQSAWSSISRDQQLYAAVNYEDIGKQRRFKIFYGSLNGGPSSLALVTNAGEDAQIVGWTAL